MAIMFPKVGELNALWHLLNQNLTARLAVNQIFVPTKDDTLASYTELTGNGYQPLTVSLSAWNFTGGNPTIATAEFVWTFAGGIFPWPITGYYVVDADGTSLLWADSLPLFNSGTRLAQTVSIGFK